MEGGDNKFAKFTVPTLKAFLKVRSQNVSGNKQKLVARARGWQKTYFCHELAISWSAKKRCKDTFFPILYDLYPVIFANATIMPFVLLRTSKFNLQRLLRNRPGSDTATSRDFLHERLQRAFTRANQLHRTAQQRTSVTHQCLLPSVRNSVACAVSVLYDNFGNQMRTVYSFRAEKCTQALLKTVYLSWSYNKSTFSTVHFDRSPVTCSCEGSKKNLIVSSLAFLLIVFRMTMRHAWQEKG